MIRASSSGNRTGQFAWGAILPGDQLPVGRIERLSVSLLQLQGLFPAIPTDQLQGPIVVLDQSRAIFTPVARVAVQHGIRLLQHRRMDMTTDHTIALASRGVIHDFVLKTANEFHATLHATLDRRTGTVGIAVFTQESSMDPTI